MPFFSVIIPLYNKENFIENTLKSVLMQTFSDFEVIVINDGSTDGGEAKILSFEDSRIRYYSTENKGVSAARNFGIELANASFIAFIDADDYWYPKFLQTVHSNILNFPTEKVFTSAIEIETSKNVVPALYSVKKTGQPVAVDFFEGSFKECIIWTSAAVFHKDVFKQAGVFDTKIRSGQDTDLWIRIGLHYHVLFDQRILARYVLDDKSLSKNRTYNHSKIDFSKFDSLEKTNLNLKKYLDINRYSLALKAKIIGDNQNFLRFSEAIDPQNLSFRKKITLKLPLVILNKLLELNHFLTNIGLRKSVFR